MTTATQEQTQREAIREMFEGGMSRGQIKDELGIPYATVYAATKDLVNVVPSTSRGRVQVDGKPRVDVIRDMFESQNKTRSEIKQALGVDYSVVWAATKGLSNDATNAEADRRVNAKAEKAAKAEAKARANANGSTPSE